MEKNYMIFELVDNTRKDMYNESCKMQKGWYNEVEDGEIMSIENYYYMCKEFAAAMGFCEKTIDEWFGED